MTDLIVEADGGSRGNPGIAGAGALVRDAEGRILATTAVPLGKASNNVAEYTGLIEGLRLAAALNPAAQVEVRMDSKLVVEQMSGRWKIKHEDMKRLAQEAKQILPNSQVSYTWIPRAQNGDADRLSNEAMDASAAGTSWDPSTSEISIDPAAEADEPGQSTTEHTEQAIIRRIAEAHDQVLQQRKRLEKLVASRAAAVGSAREAGISPMRIADELGVSADDVRQMLD